MANASASASASHLFSSLLSFFFLSIHPPPSSSRLPIAPGAFVVVDFNPQSKSIDC
jgi:hypothetical protein